MHFIYLASQREGISQTHKVNAQFTSLISIINYKKKGCVWQYTFYCIKSNVRLIKKQKTKKEEEEGEGNEVQRTFYFDANILSVDV
jgi:hypothetical protein